MSRVGAASQRQHENARIYRRRFRSGRATVLPGIPGMFQRTAEMATKAAEYKAKRGLFDPTSLITRESDSYLDQKSAR